MKIKCFNINEWLYPDTVIEREVKDITITAVRGGDNCFSILTDLSVKEGTPVSYKAEGIDATVFTLGEVTVPHNSGLRNCVTDDDDAVMEYVTRRAPFEVFDITLPITDDGHRGGRVAFFVRVNAKKDMTHGEHCGKITVYVGDESATVNVTLKVSKTALYDVKDTPYSMVNWIRPTALCHAHGVERGAEEYYKLLGDYFENQIDMRNTHFQLPTLIPITDQNGTVIDFDTEENEKIGALALECGFKYIYGGFVAHWNNAKEAPQFLEWDRSICVEQFEGVRQLDIYFKRIREMIEKMGWQDVYMQGLVDEPQVASSVTYRALCGLSRKYLPYTKIIDPVETPDIHATCDIQVIKQGCYDSDIEAYEKLRLTSDELWVYTCGYPANRWQNRVLDLPLSATRLPIWQSVAYDMTGFLHWGYNSYAVTMDPMRDTCHPCTYHGEPTFLPAGNHAVMYCEGMNIYDSVRSHLQRISAAEGELLLRLCKKDKKICKDLIATVTHNFYDYENDADALESAHDKLLVICDKLEV